MTAFSAGIVLLETRPTGCEGRPSGSALSEVFQRAQEVRQLWGGVDGDEHEARQSHRSAR